MNSPDLGAAAGASWASAGKMLGITLLGIEGMVRDRLRGWRDAGVDSVANSAKLKEASTHPESPTLRRRPSATPRRPPT